MTSRRAWLCALMFLGFSGLPACGVLSQPETYAMGPYRFQVSFASRVGTAYAPTIEILFRVFRDEESRADFCRAFAGRMRVLDQSGAVHSVELHPIKRDETSKYWPWEGYVGVAKLTGTSTRKISVETRGRAGDLRLVIDNPAPRWYQHKQVVVQLH